MRKPVGRSYYDSNVAVYKLWTRPSTRFSPGYCLAPLRAYLSVRVGKVNDTASVTNLLARFVGGRVAVDRVHVFYGHKCLAP